MINYKDTLHLPATTFPLRGHFSVLEDRLRTAWQTDDGTLSSSSDSAPSFVLHSGPPFANGHIHLGHSVNIILKDVIGRWKRQEGYTVDFRPGWDCHGLPIEQRVEAQFLAQKKKKADIPLAQWRQECRTCAQTWQTIQHKEFQNLGVQARWSEPYTTMDPTYEAQVVDHVFRLRPYIYRDHRPILWSIWEQTALAEAEVEYKTLTSPAWYVALPLIEDPNTFVMIWTTTPWTLPANQGVCYHPHLQYEKLYIRAKTLESRVPLNTLCYIAQDLRQDFCHRLGITDYTIEATFLGQDLPFSQVKHPLCRSGYDFSVPLWPANHVTADKGTGFVHTAPAHGLEDYYVAKEHKIPVLSYVNARGIFADHCPTVGGQHITKARDILFPLMKDTLWHEHAYQHSYPHSWRSKKPLIFRATPQWFISLDHNHLRERALAALQHVQFIPESSRHRMEDMLKQRPDWCISRQRSWGIPLPFFLHRSTQELLNNPQVDDNIRRLICHKGSDAWFDATERNTVLPASLQQDYEPLQDILDVWFESGSSFGLMPQGADLYLEGSDQHRGWFQSSLLISTALQDTAPYRTLMTHGFVVKKSGEKLSKSGDVDKALTLETLKKTYGVDGIRLWVMLCDVTEDMPLSSEALNYARDVLMRFRNTLRYCLGNLSSATPEQTFTLDHTTSAHVTSLPPLEQWILHELYTLNAALIQRKKTYHFQGYVQDLHRFCSHTLSTLYFDLRKDTLYCGSDACRGQVHQVLDRILHHVCIYLAPLACFSAEEAWQHRYPETSVHAQPWPTCPETWKNPAVASSFQVLWSLRKTVCEALEIYRKTHPLKGNLDAHISLTLPLAWQTDIIMPLEDITLTSQVDVTYANITDPTVQVQPQTGQKCPRCWKIGPWDTLCLRCTQVVTTGP